MSTTIIIIAGSLLSVIFTLFLCIIPFWKIFTKAGEAGWKCLIPIYNFYTLLKIAKCAKSFFIMIFCSIIYGVCAYLYVNYDGMELIYPIVTIIIGILCLVLTIRFIYKLSKSFGHGIGFTLGLIFLNIIFIPILGYGKSSYIYNENNNDVDIQQNDNQIDDNENEENIVENEENTTNNIDTNNNESINNNINNEEQEEEIQEISLDDAPIEF